MCIAALEQAGLPFEGQYPFFRSDRPCGITGLEVTYNPPAGADGTLLETVKVPAKDSDHTECVM
jgi:hypothetical protein